VSPRELDETLRRFERTLVREGGSEWREAILGGEAAEVVWPADLPPLTADLKTWFAWRPASDGGALATSWRSASWAAEAYHWYEVDPSFRRSLVPVLRGYVVDVEDGSLWGRELDMDTGLDRFVREPFANLSEFLASMEAEYAARRRSPCRRFRVDRGDGPKWTLLEGVPDAALLAQMPIGRALRAVGSSSKRRKGRLALKGQFALKIAPTTWLMTSFHPSLLEDDYIDDALRMVRYGFAAGGDTLETDLDDEAAAERLASLMKGWSANGPVDLRSGVVRVWQQPPMSELLGRLDRELTRVAPHVRRALASPARDADIAVLEAELGASLPADLRALWAFAGGQTTQDALYWGYRLVSVADARSTIAMMLGLAADQFGEAYWHRALVPLLDKGNGDYVCVDVAGAYGPEGCIVDFDHAWPERRQILFDSPTEWLECYVDGLEAGLYVADPDGGIFPHEFLETGSLYEITRHNDIRTNGRYPWERHLRMRPGSTSRSDLAET
jgi:cell wall assembly regulator SMI1